MTVRGIYSTLFFYPESYTPPGTPIAVYQNYSPTAIPTLAGGVTYSAEYRPFTVSELVSDSNSITNDFAVTFAATGAISISWKLLSLTATKLLYLLIFWMQT